MAKRRNKAKSRTITLRRQATSKRRSRSSSLKSDSGMIIGSMMYGGVRAKLNAMLRPLTNKVPLGAIADEVVLLGGAMLLKKRIRNPTLRNVLNAGIVVEAARIGEAIVDGSAFSMFGGNSAITNSF